MAKLIKQADGTYATETGKNVGNLDLAARRGNAEDLANIEFAKKTYGYVPTAVPTSPSAGSTSGISKTNPLLPNANVTSGLVPAGVPESDNESDIFNLLTRDALIKFQGVNTADLEKKKRALQLTALDKQAEITPEDLRTFSPAQQAAIRSGDIKALQPEFDDVAYQLNKAQQATANFEKIYEKVMSISQDYATKMTAPESVIQNYKQLIESDPENINTYLSKVNDKTRDAIINVLDYTKMKPKEETDTQVITANGRSLLINKTTGEVIKDLGDTESDTDAGTSDYKNWMLAGGQAGTGKTFAQWLTKNDGGRPLTPAQTNLISEGKQLQLVLNPLYQTIKNNENAFGPVSGFFGSANPYNTNAQTIDAEMRRASQTIGKYMEGGVLRKEDEEKYRKMLPQLTDTPAVAKNKLDGVKDLLSGKIKSYINDYTSAGFDTSSFNEQSSSNKKYNSLSDIKNSDPTGYNQLVPIIQSENLSEEEALRLYEISFNSVGGDTNLATAVASIPDGQSGGQCGRFVNQISGLGVGDSYQSKMAKMDKNIKYPAPGMIFTMPYKDTGHTGIILEIDGNNAIVKDSNYSLDGKIKTHTIPIAKMTGFAKIT